MNTWPLAANHPTLIVSPHLDDAALSCAALLEREGVQVLTVCSGRPTNPFATAWDTTCGFPDSSAAMDRRRREDAAALDNNGVRTHHLPLLDGGYLGRPRDDADNVALTEWVDGWVRSAANGIRPIVVIPAGAGRMSGRLAGKRKAPGSASGNRSAPSFQELQKLTATHSRRLIWRDRARAVLGPVGRFLAHRIFLRKHPELAKGLLAHGDHLFVRDALVLSLLASDAADIVLYEDFPYLWSKPADSAVSQLLESLNISGLEMRIQIDTMAKFERMRCYASQLPHLDPKGRRLEAHDTLPASERYWMLSKESAQIVVGANGGPGFPAAV